MRRMHPADTLTNRRTRLQANIPRRVCRIAAVLAVCLMLSGCDDAMPVIAGTPTPSASPTPLPAPFEATITELPDAAPEVTPDATDLSGYLSFGDIRVYEYGEDTFLDGVCINAYPSALTGRTDVVYYGSDGRKLGEGTIHNAEGTGILRTGKNNIYAEIGTDIDVRMLDFVLEIKQAYTPIAEDTPRP